MPQHKTADEVDEKKSLSERIKKKERTIEKIETFIATNEPKTLTVHKGMSKFTLRGKKRVGIQNLLYYIVHNIGKIATLGAQHLCEVTV